MKRYVICFLLGFVAYAHGASTQQLSVKEAVRQKLLLKHPTPEYPLEARRKLWKGSGMFELEFDQKTGQVRDVRVIKSTGRAVLDAYSIRALKLWRAKPQSLKVMRVPVTFTYHR
jgi:TonB family protein